MIKKIKYTHYDIHKNLKYKRRFMWSFYSLINKKNKLRFQSDTYCLSGRCQSIRFIEAIITYNNCKTNIYDI